MDYGLISFVMIVGGAAVSVLYGLLFENNDVKGMKRDLVVDEVAFTIVTAGGSIAITELELNVVSCIATFVIIMLLGGAWHSLGERKQLIKTIEKLEEKGWL